MSPATRLSAEPREDALWMLERLSPGTAANHLSVTFAVAARLDRRVLEQALAAVLRRHQALRTVYSIDGGELTKRIIELDDQPLVTELVVDDRDRDDLLADWVRRPFTFDESLLVRAALIRDGNRSLVSVVLHHLVFDTISAVPFLGELAESYESLAEHGRLPQRMLGELEQLPQPTASAESRQYWLQALDDYDPNAVQLACRRFDTDQVSLTGAVVVRELTSADRQNLRELQRKLKAPESTVLLTAFWLLLHAHGGGDDIAIGNPVNTRPRDGQQAIGYHVNVLPLRIQLSAQDTVGTLTRQARERFFEGLAHQDVPVDELTPLIGREGGSWRSMLVNHVFNYVSSDVLPSFELAGAATETVHVENGCSKFDLELFVISTDDRLRLRLAYNTEVLTAADAGRLLERYRALLIAMAAGPDLPITELDGWSERDHQAIDPANDTAAPVPAESLLHRLLRRAAEQPTGTALVEHGRAVSWAELAGRAGALAGQLTEAGVSGGDVIALCLPRGRDLAAAVLASWLVGGSYLPIDPALPAERIGYQLADSGAVAVLAAEPDARLDGHGVQVLQSSAAGERAELPQPINSSAPAYLIYTSGSTGRPKGTRIGQPALANLVEHFARELAIGPGQRMLWSTSFAFDISVLELMVPLSTGATVVAAADAVRVDPAAMRAALAERIDYVQATPTTWRLVLDGVAEQLGPVTVLVGGEPLPLPTARRLAGAARAVHHVYGPTETTVWSSSQLLPPNPELILIGRPIANTTFAVLGPDGRSLPVGVRGELWIGGTGVADGYHGRAELTAQRFTEHAGQRGYRTGDLAQWTEDGQLQLFGRSDRQVKLRGNRIELGEIETVLAGHPAVRSAAAVVTGTDTTDAQLVAFIELVDDDSLDSVWEFARTQLPHGYLPQQLAVLAQLPVNLSNKIDYPRLTEQATALLARAVADQGGSATAVQDGDDPLAVTLIQLWAELLEADEPVSADTHFFRSGGHSVLGAVLIQRIKADLDIAVPLAELFDAPTPRQFAARIVELTEDRTEESA